MTTMFPDWLTGAAASILTQLPVYLVWLAGVVVALSRWNAHPRISGLFLVAVGIVLMTSLVAAFVYAWMPQALLDRGVEGSRIGLAFRMVAFVQAIIEAACWGMMIVAVFADRPGKIKAPPSPWV